MKLLGKYANFFHLHPEVPGVAVVLGVVLFACCGAPQLTQRIAQRSRSTANTAVWVTHNLLERSASTLPKVLNQSDCETQRRKEAIRKYLRRELEERARQKSHQDAGTPRRSRVELI